VKSPRQSLVGLGFVAPFLICYVALLIYPLCAGLALSLQRADLFGARSFAGFGNYARLARDPVFAQAVLNTVWLVLMTVPALTGLSLALAMALNRRNPVAGVFRGLFFSSSILSVTIVTLIWRFVLTPDGGLFAELAHAAGREPLPFLSDRRLVLPALAVTSIWWCIGLPMMLFLAALQQIPQDVYEAAALDGASPATTFRRVTFPAIRRTVLLVVLIETVLQFQMFGQAQVLTQGGPNGASRPIVLFIYDMSFGRWDIGYAAAAAQVLFVFMLVASALQYVGRAREEAR
jgi:multiple sugar transport system permease protein